MLIDHHSTGGDGRADEDGNPTPKLRIAMVAPPWFTVPPKGYGGTESVVAGLVDALVARGHEVTLLGAGQSGTTASRFIRSYEEPPHERLGEPLPELVHAAVVADALAGADIDVVHDHTLAGPLLARGRNVPTLVTAHGPVTGEPCTYLEALGKTIGLVAISSAQQRSAHRLNWAGMVHNGISAASYPFQTKKDDYVLWMGRFNPGKGPVLAIEAARAAGVGIILAGKRNEEAERRYFDEAIVPHLGPRVEYVGEADASLKRELFARARCLVNPICWDEPFGMVMIEAMACGTPVVALRRGAVPEVVLDGTTGIVVDRPEQLPGAIESSAYISSLACRQHVEAHFSLGSMATGYERLYLRHCRQPISLAVTGWAPSFGSRTRGPAAGVPGTIDLMQADKPISAFSDLS